MKKILAVLLIIACPAFALAHGYWIELQGSHKVNEPVTIRLYFGEYVAGERLSGKSLDRMKDLKVSVRGEQIKMQQQNDYWEGQYTPAEEGLYIITAVNDEREVQDWTQHDLGIVRPIQYLKTVYQVGALKVKGTKPLFLDVVTKKEKDNTYVINVLRNQSAFDSAKITITHPDKKDTNLAGDGAIFTAPVSGLYIISVEWIDKTSGEFKGKKYESVRHRMDYTFYN